ncbi:MFS transporter [Alteraurantiacibacter aestuarii]|uniref:MFS transporter n=1 Tax=Alteraurantiacibacter aestuarii TaxID=650004 RepID=A0A844ZTA1_9SPHN|nr:MFS transporter [Alteraurantiacibacter aestuarii]MXO88799.1 MFS transporter [Alteraurantiacibacter aestuarii]
MQTDKKTEGWDTSYEWKIILILSLTFGLVGLDRFILPVLFPAFMDELGLTYEDLGNLVGILAVFWGISAFAMGFLSDRVGRRKVLIPAVIIFSLMSALSGMAGGLVGLLIIRAIMGLAEGPVASTGVAVAVEASHPKRRGMNNGIFQCMISLFGNAIGPIIATQLLLVTDWRTVFMLVGIPGLIMAAAMFFVIREPAHHVAAGKAAPGEPAAAPVVRPSIPDLFKHRNVPLAMFTLMCAMGGVFVMGAMMPNYLTDYLQLSLQDMGIVTAAIGFGGCIGQFAMPTLSDFIGRKVTILISYILAAVFTYLFTQAGAESLSTLFWLLFFAALFNFSALAILAGPVAAEAAPLGMVASVAGLVIGAGEIFGGGVAPVIAGQIAGSSGIQHVFTFAIASLIVGFFIALFLKETAPRKTGLE